MLLQTAIPQHCTIPTNYEITAVHATVHTPRPVRVEVDIERGADTCGWWIVYPTTQREGAIFNGERDWFLVQREDLKDLTAFVQVER